MAFSGLIQGPPLIAQPGQLCIESESPSLWHSSATKRMSPSHDLLRHLICGETPGQGLPSCPWKRRMPAMPASLIASKSAVMPSFATLPPIKKTYVSGRFAADGLRNSPSGSPAALTDAANAIAAAVNIFLICVIVA